MSRSLNKVQIIGNLTQDPEVRQTPGGASVCSMSVATNRQWTDQNGNKQEKAELRDLFLAAEEVAFSNEKNLKDVLNKWSNKSRLSHINTEAGNFFLHIFNNAFQSMFFASSMERLKPKKFTNRLKKNFLTHCTHFLA